MSDKVDVIVEFRSPFEDGFVDEGREEFDDVVHIFWVCEELLLDLVGFCVLIIFIFSNKLIILFWELLYLISYCYVMYFWML